MKILQISLEFLQSVCFFYIHLELLSFIGMLLRIIFRVQGTVSRILWRILGIPVGKISSDSHNLVGFFEGIITVHNACLLSRRGLMKFSSKDRMGRYKDSLISACFSSVLYLFFKDENRITIRLLLYFDCCHRRLSGSFLSPHRLLFHPPHPRHPPLRILFSSQVST